MSSSYEKSSFDTAKLIALCERLEPIISKFPEGVTLLVENLFPFLEWQAMTHYQRIKTGEMVALLVSEKMLSLDFLDTNRATQRYIKK